jgi:Tfp pilus assembly protein PilX
MRLSTPRASLARRLASEDGFTMLFALLALMVGTLLVAAAFTAANGDIKLTQRATAQAKAYYAAVAGVSRYQYQLKSSPEYWTKCPTIGEGTPVKVPGTSDEAYAVKTLPASKHTLCESGKQASILETTGTANGTFRILSTGTVTEGSKTVTRKIVATFSHPGFTKYVYESNYEVEDPVNLGKSASTCEYYYAERVSKGLTGTCPVIQFAPTDEVNGPMHTNDAAATCTKNGVAPKFGREGRNDEIEMNGGHYAPSGCTNEPNIVGTYTTTAGSVLPPPTDQEILEAAELKFDGRTEIELKSGTPSTMLVKNKNLAGGEQLYNFPSNGVLYVENSKSEACAVTNSTPFGSDVENDSGCGNVYVHGKYSESLTIASADDVIINGNLETSHESSGEPTGGATLGLIAENYVRLYHPVKKGYTTTHTTPASEAPIEGKCVTEKEVGGTLLHAASTEVTEISTSGLTAGDEIKGTAGQTEAGTTISKLEAGNKVILSKNAKAAAKELSAKLVNGSTEVKEINTTGLVVGAEVAGTVAGEIEAGTTISEIKAAENKIKLSQAANTALLKEASGQILRSTEVTGISTTGLVVGEDVEGPSGQIPAGTKISSIKSSESKIILSQAATPPATTRTGRISSGSTTVSEISTSGLSVGEEVEGSGIPANTKITEVKTFENRIKLSNAATESRFGATLKIYGETVALKFYNHEETGKVKVYDEVAKFKVYHATGYALNSSLGVCHKVEGSPYTEYRETENLYIVKCEFGSSYTNEAFCEYPISSSSCSSKATNLSAEEDPNHWGAQQDPVIDAAILSTKHSWIVDNWTCGATLGTINLWGSIAQYWRGPVGQTGSHGYVKNYNYDDRLANQQPPSFLSPTNASSWKVTRETAPPAGFTG